MVMYGMISRYAAFSRSLCVAAAIPKYTRPIRMIPVMLKYFTMSFGTPFMFRMKRTTPMAAIAVMNHFIVLFIRVCVFYQFDGEIATKLAADCSGEISHKRHKRHKKASWIFVP